MYYTHTLTTRNFFQLMVCAYFAYVKEYVYIRGCLVKAYVYISNNLSDNIWIIGKLFVCLLRI